MSFQDALKEAVNDGEHEEQFFEQSDQFQVKAQVGDISIYEHTESGKTVCVGNSWILPFTGFDRDVDQDKVRAFVDEATQYNVSDISERTGISRNTLHDYKKDFRGMSRLDRNLIILRAAAENIREIQRKGGVLK